MLGRRPWRKPRLVARLDNAGGAASATTESEVMLNFLFPRLTADPARGAKSLEAITALARDPAFYRDGGVPDTLDGRFALLATITALALVRIEREGEAGNCLAVAMTERFIEVMEAEHRELGMSDPTLGKTVRKLVGSLSRRVDLWRSATAAEIPWNKAVASSLFKDAVPNCPLDQTERRLRDCWARLEATSLGDLAKGQLP